jgi:hypothetical protein
MRDYLLDLVDHTYSLGSIDTIKIVGDDDITKIQTVASDKSVILYGHFITPSPDFKGIFGMPNLGKLKSILNLDEYAENAKITLKRKEDTSPEGVSFVNASGDFKNEYRFMSQSAVDGALKVPDFNGAKWSIEFTPTVTSIQRLRLQSQVAMTELFRITTVDGNLVCMFGDQSSHAGNFVFEQNVGGQLTKTWGFPSKVVLTILGLSGDKTIHISNDGLIQITVNSGLAIYNYMIPARSK